MGSSLLGKQDKNGILTRNDQYAAGKQNAGQNLGGRLATTPANQGRSQFEGFQPSGRPFGLVAVTHTIRPGIFIRTRKGKFFLDIP